MKFKPGDLVMLVKPRSCCGQTANIGKIFVVTDGRIPDLMRCSGCGFLEPAGNKYVPLDTGSFAQSYRLRLIPPLSDPESIDVPCEVLTCS